MSAALFQVAVNELVRTDSLQVMELDGDRIRHTTKIWNDAIDLKRMGCA